MAGKPSVDMSGRVTNVTKMKRYASSTEVQSMIL